MSRFTKLRRPLAAIGATALALVGITAGMAATTAPSAQAHTGDMSAAAVCNTSTGNYDVTYTLRLKDVPRGQTGSTKWHFGDTQFVSGWSERSFSWSGGQKEVAGNGTITFAQTLPGTTKVGPWVYAFTKWSPDGFTVKSDTRVEGLKGDCTKTPPPFDWNWQYDPPTCEGLTVHYPDNLPDGQSKNVNIRVKNLSTGEVQTFNFHNNTGTWSGTKTFNVKDHPNWPGWTWYEYQWTQVAGTNYHWEGSVTCGEEPPPPPVKPEPIIEKLTDQRMSCEVGVEDGTATKTTDWVLNPEGSAYVKGEPVISDWTWTFTRDLTAAEKLSLDCDKPEPPKPTVIPLNDERATCEFGVQTRTGTETSATVFDESTWTWVPTDSIVEWSDWTFSRSLTVAEKYELNCDKPIKPEPLKGSDVVETPKCLPEGGGVINITTTEWTQQPKWNDELWKWDGYEDKVYSDPVTTTRPATAEECPNTLIVVEPPAPKFQDLCGTENDLVIPSVAENGEYSSFAEKIGNEGRVIYEPNPGYTFPKGYNPEFTHTFTDDPCPTEPPTEEPPVTPSPTDPPTDPEPTKDPDPTDPPKPSESPSTTTTPTPTQTVTKSVTVPVNKQSPPSKPQASLAQTGANNTVIGLGVAGSMLLLGTVTLVARRRMSLDR